MHEHLTRAWVEIDLGALQQNGAAIAARAQTPLLPMVKADGYGLGALATVRALEPLAPWGYGVATVREGRALREAGVGRPVIVFTPLLEADLPAACAARLTPALARAECVAAWRALGGGPWHLAVDTGMSRSGVPWNDFEPLLAEVTAAPPEGAFTHFHSAERDPASVREQVRRFHAVLARMPVRPALLHAENSAAVARTARSTWDLVRPGVFLYGVSSGAGAELVPRPVASVRARIVELRTVANGETVSYGATYRAIGARRIATLAIGYADGYRRSLSNRGAALVHGCRVPVAGVVTMDMTMLDVTDVPCAVGDVATLVGTDGDAELTVDAVAHAADISPYELLTGLCTRLERVYEEAS